MELLSLLHASWFVDFFEARCMVNDEQKGQWETKEFSNSHAAIPRSPEAWIEVFFLGWPDR